MEEVIVLKFGSSVLRSGADLPNAVHEIYRWRRAGFQTIAVVSAIGYGTEELLSEAREICAGPEPYATAELVATGERVSAALMVIALDRSGLRARVANPREIGLFAVGGPLDSELVSLDEGRLQELVAEYDVLVVPGFFGTDLTGRTHLLGCGGSDLTAVFLAQRLGARCRLIKDVDGVYERDPALVAEQAGPEARSRRFISLSYADALQVAGPLIQPKAVSFLQRHAVRAEVAANGADYESVVHGHGSHLDVSRDTTEPSRVLLLGLGTVGFGVYQRLLANPTQFTVVGALVRDRGRYERLGVPGGLLRSRADQLIKLRADIVVDALSDADVATQLAEVFLKRGTDFVSAGKKLIAESGVFLGSIAKDSGATLSYSAAVGGSTPMIEAVDQSAASSRITALAGVLNGTCNLILERCREGTPFEEALAEAQRAGYAEVDPTDDLNGMDAARKLSILMRHAFGSDVQVVNSQRLDASVASRAFHLGKQGCRLRQVARAQTNGVAVEASVAFEEVPEDSVLGRVGAEWNALDITLQDGRTRVVTGRGAGRWPTTEAIVADLFEARRLRLRKRVLEQARPESAMPICAEDGGNLADFGRDQVKAVLGKTGNVDLDV